MTKVLHIIPAAFQYYEDIKSAAFNMVSVERNFGIDAEAVTIQYQTSGAPAATGAPGAEKPPDRKYLGAVSLALYEKEMESFDAVHVHVPIMGSIGKIISWKKQFPRVRLIVTVHRALLTPDFFSIILLVYNRIMLKKLFAAADCIATPNLDMLDRHYHRLIESVTHKVVVVAGDKQFMGEPLARRLPQAQNYNPEQLIAVKYIILYTIDTKL